jgi:predicted small lipoprotein YifL
MNRRHAALFAAIALLGLALSACGNKGPLVLPDKPADGTTADGTAGQPADGAKTPDR